MPVKTENREPEYDPRRASDIRATEFTCGTGGGRRVIRKPVDDDNGGNNDTYKD